MAFLLIGIDEAGRGPLAGPVTAAAVILPPGFFCMELRDSKRIDEATRFELAELIKREALAWSVVSEDQSVIDSINILEATKRAMAKAAEAVTELLGAQGFQHHSIHCVLDGNQKCATTLSQEPIIKGDDKLQVISAASILAKVSRDLLMKEIDQQYPGYGLAMHKGYPTKFHREQIKHLGPSPVHRRTFAGVREYLQVGEIFNNDGPKGTR